MPLEWFECLRLMLSNKYCTFIYLIFIKPRDGLFGFPKTYSPAAVGVRVKLNDKVFFFFDYSSIGSQ